MVQGPIAEIHVEKLWKGTCVVNADEHVTVDDADRTIFTVKKGGKLTLKLGSECTINSEQGAEVNRR